MNTKRTINKEKRRKRCKRRKEDKKQDGKRERRKECTKKVNKINPKLQQCVRNPTEENENTKIRLKVAVVRLASGQCQEHPSLERTVYSYFRNYSCSNKHRFCISRLFHFPARHPATCYQNVSSMLPSVPLPPSVLIFVRHRAPLSPVSSPYHTGIYI